MATPQQNIPAVAGSPPADPASVQQNLTIPSELFWRILREDLRVETSDVQPIVDAGATTSMQIVAGAGTGKTTALVLKMLYAVYVEGLDTAEILATTFTRKAARELSSKLLGTNERFLEALRARDPAAYEGFRFRDLNTIEIGTTDSIVQAVLNEFKTPLSPPPVPIEPFVARGLMLQQLFSDGRFRNAALGAFLQRFRPSSFNATSPSAMAALLYQLRNFALTSNLDRERYLQHVNDPGARLAFEIIDDFDAELNERRVADYPAISALFLARLRDGALDPFATRLRFILVDEYQDTEFLQERIYFELAARALQRGGALVVVGDDDQALYRFRGATVGLFRNFPQRFRSRFGRAPASFPLVTNWRSTAQIIEYCQAYVTNDPGYVAGRTPKPPLVPPTTRRRDGPRPYLVLADGQDASRLSAQVAKIIRDVRSGWTPRAAAEQIALDPDRGTPGDIAIIAASAREIRDNGQPTFLGFLRGDLARFGINLFNPRGRAFADIPHVQVLLGSLLDILDPDDAIIAGRNLPADLRQTLATWRQSARAWAANPPSHVRPGLTLQEYKDSFRRPRQVGGGKIKTMLTSEVIYRLVTWMPFYQEDLEGLAYLEVIQRALAQSETLGKWNSKIAYDEAGHLIEPSVIELLWNFLVPLANNELDVDEDLLVTMPPNRVPVLTTHQAKGLQYPMVIVDIGSWIKDGRAHPVLRFPNRDPDTPNLLNRELGAFCEYVDNSRSEVDARFDDMIRKYFVAASRAQDCLVLVAHQGGISRGVSNLAAWYRRDGTVGPRNNYTERAGP